MRSDTVAFARLEVRKVIFDLAVAQDFRVNIAAKTRREFHIQLAAGETHFSAESMPAARRNGNVDLATLNRGRDQPSRQRQIRG